VFAIKKLFDYAKHYQASPHQKSRNTATLNVMNKYQVH